MPTPALLILIAMLLPLAAFVLLAFIGRRMGRPLAGWVASICIFGSFALSMGAMIAWFNGGQIQGVTWGPGDKPIEIAFKWLPVGIGVAQDHPGFLDLGIYIDSLTIAMFNTASLVLLLIYLYSVGYLSENKRFAAFFTYMSLLTFSTLGLMAGGTLLQILIFWQLQGLAAYLLIGLWRENTEAVRGASSAFIIQRIGDAAFFVGIGILFHCLGNASLLQIDRWLSPIAAGGSGAMRLPNDILVSYPLLTAAGISIFIAIAVRAAQFPFQVWLGDSLAAPVPATAAIQSITLIASAVYLLGRLFPILTPDAKLFIAMIGIVTLLMGALIACAQRDLRAVLAYCTVSQGGLMVMAIGVGSWGGALFHLVSHSFIKALLLLAAGSVIRAAQGESDLSRLGGLRRNMPLTATVFGIAALALSAAPFTCGFYSNEMIFSHAAAFTSSVIAGGHTIVFRAFVVVPAIAMGLTAFYIARCWMLIFWGKPRDAELLAEARESANLWVALIALAMLSLVGGSRLLDIRRFIVQSQIETENYCNENHPAAAAIFDGFGSAWPIGAESIPDSIRLREDAGSELFQHRVIWISAVGLLLGILCYWRGFALSRAVFSLQPFAAVRHWLRAGMYFEEMYSSVFVTLIMAAAWIVSRIDIVLGGTNWKRDKQPGAEDASRS